MKKKMFLLGVIGLLMPFSADALSGNVSLSCDKTKLNVGESTTCSIKGNITEEVSAVSAKIELGENLTLVSVTTDSSWQGDGEDGNIELYTDNNKTGEFNIGTFIVKAGTTTGVSSSISLKDVALSDASFNEQSFTVNPVSIRVPSTVNTLKDITIDGKTINDFSSDKTDYSVSVDSNVSGIVLGVTLTDTSAKATGYNNNTKLNYGVNNIKIIVTSESGSSKTYTVKVIRSEIRELESLKINDKSIELTSGTYNYDLTISNDVTSVSLSAVLFNEKNALFVDGYGSRTVNDLKVGNNAILVKVVDNNGEELTYTINVNRLDVDGKDIVDGDISSDNSNNGNSTVKNPNTGIKVSVAIGSIVLISVCLVYVVVRKKNYFKKI